jgi:hypothetical protein
LAEGGMGGLSYPEFWIHNVCENGKSRFTDSQSCLPFGSQNKDFAYKVSCLENWAKNLIKCFRNYAKYDCII